VEEAVTGRLYGVGVGPGDPELMTLKAVRILAEAPVIAYPAPNNGESSARAIAESFIPAGRTEIAIRVPMRVGLVPVEAYALAAEEIADHLHAERDVAVLCEGDPFFYGSFIYIHDALAGRFPTIVVPGVCSLTACAAASGRSLVRRDDALTIVPATLGDDELSRRLRDCDAAAIMKVGRHLSRLRKLLGELGLLASAIYVSHATRENQRVMRLEDLTDSEAPYFSMILTARAHT
jgi:precorrin-2/cobalt-factor-2 C20-methyltransferase